MAASDVISAMEAAVSYLESGDYSSAILSATKALAYLASIPDSRHGSGEMRWRSTDIREFISQCERLQAGANGLGSTGGVFQTQKVVYVNPDSECY